MKKSINTIALIVSIPILIMSCATSHPVTAATPQFDNTAVETSNSSENKKNKPVKTEKNNKIETTQNDQTEQKHARYQTIADEVNKQCPLKIEENTRIDSASYSPEQNEFSYHYTILESQKAHLTEDQLTVAKNASRQLIISKLKSTQALDRFRADKIIMVFTYQDEKGNTLFTIKINPDEYSSPQTENTGK